MKVSELNYQIRELERLLIVLDNAVEAAREEVRTMKYELACMPACGQRPAAISPIIEVL